MNKFLNLANQDLLQIATQHKEKYAAANPFPSIALDDFFDPDYLDGVLKEFPDLSKGNNIQFNDPLQKKFAGHGEKLFGPRTLALMHYLNSESFIKFVQTLTGIEETLFGDPYFLGGGMHEIKSGGLLKVHADFNKHPVSNLDRRVNLIIYLNKDWEDSYGGDFELWNADMTECVDTISPHFNRIALFSTTSISYHGHPNALTCPADRSRKSLALYYYSNGRPENEAVAFREGHNSIFVARKNSEEDAKSWAAYADHVKKKSLARRIYNKIFK